MGQVASTQNRLSEPVTLPRIYNACQFDSNMPEELRKFNISLLADDMNKLGANVPTSGSTESICRAVESYIPNAGQVCMIGNKNSKESVYNTAKIFNNQYGTRIPVFKNGVDKSGGYRDVSDICDDMYSVQSRVHRSLENDTSMVKRKLVNGIKELRAQQRMLDTEFSNYYNMLTKGPKLDGLKAQMAKDLQMQQNVVSMVGAERNTLENMYGTYYNGIQAIQPYMQAVPTATIQTGGRSRDYMKDVENIMTGTINTSLMAQGISECFKAMDTSYDEYLAHSRKPVEELRMWVDQKFRESRIDPKNRGKLFNESMVYQCANSLINQRDHVNTIDAVKRATGEAVDEQCRAVNVHNNIKDRQGICEGSFVDSNGTVRGSLCAWINGTCQANSATRSGPQQANSRWLEYNQYTINSLNNLRFAISEQCNSDDGECTSKVPGGGSPEDYINSMETLFIDKLFGEHFTEKIQTHTSLGKLIDTRSADVEGIQVNEYVSYFHGETLKVLMGYIIDKHELNVSNHGQDTLMAETFVAFANNDCKSGRCNENAPYFPSVADMEKVIYEFCTSSTDCETLYIQHNAWIELYLNPFMMSTELGDDGKFGKSIMKA